MHTSAFLSSGAGGEASDPGPVAPLVRANREIDVFHIKLGVRRDPLFRSRIGVVLGIFCLFSRQNWRGPRYLLSFFAPKVAENRHFRSPYVSQIRSRAEVQNPAAGLDFMEKWTRECSADESLSSTDHSLAGKIQNPVPGRSRLNPAAKIVTF